MERYLTGTHYHTGTRECQNKSMRKFAFITHQAEVYSWGFIKNIHQAEKQFKSKISRLKTNF